MKKIKDIFNWNLRELINSIVGVFAFSLAINLFITPNNLYTGGILGVSQLIRTLILSITNIKVNFDISSVIYYLINIPLFYLAYKKISKHFFARTVLCVTLQSIFLIIIPTLDKPIVSDILTNVVLAGIFDGIGIGLLLSSGASSGGSDIIGMAISKKNKNMSVGKIGMVINVIVYAASGIMHGVEIMVYSMIYSAISSFVLDKTHYQNICSSAFIFTKDRPKEMTKFIKNELDRSVTFWEATGAYENTSTYVTYVALSKYELQKLEKYIELHEKNAFIVKQDGVGINGEFAKKLVD